MIFNYRDLGDYIVHIETNNCIFYKLVIKESDLFILFS